MYSPRVAQFVNAIIPLVALCILLGLWQAVCLLTGVSKIILPTPLAVGTALWVRLSHLGENTAITMLEALIGFLLACAVGVGLAALFVHSSTARRALYPLAVAVKTTPLVTLAPLLVVWFGGGILSKVVMAATLAFFPILVGVFDGLRRIEPELLDLMKSLAASRWQIFTKVRLPQSLPSFFSALRVAAPMSVVGAVIGEYTGSTEGIGHVINTASYYLNTELVFAAILCISIASGVFFLVVCVVEKFVVFWK